MYFFQYRFIFLQFALRKKTKKGFLLFEIGVLLIVIALTSLTIMNWYCKIVSANSLSKEKMNAILYGMNIIEKFYIYNDFIPEKNEKYEIRYKTYYDLELPNYKHLELVIIFGKANITEQISFKTGKVK